MGNDLAFSAYGASGPSTIAVDCFIIITEQYKQTRLHTQQQQQIILISLIDDFNYISFIILLCSSQIIFSLSHIVEHNVLVYILAVCYVSYVIQKLRIS